MAPDYVTVYEIAPRLTAWWFSFVIGLLIGVGGVTNFLLKRRSKKQMPHPWMILFGVVWWFMWMVMSISSIRASKTAYTEALAEYRSHDYETVEGIVTDFSPMPFSGHKDECFSVQQKRFCYSDFIEVPGFHQSASHGGPIRAGLPVHIVYNGQTIYKIDIPRDQIKTSK